MRKFCNDKNYNRTTNSNFKNKSESAILLDLTFNFINTFYGPVKNKIKDNFNNGAK